MACSISLSHPSRLSPSSATWGSSSLLIACASAATARADKASAEAEIGEAGIENCREIHGDLVFGDDVSSFADFDALEYAERSNKILPLLKRWLSKEDYADLLAEYPTIRKIKPVFYGVMNYYYEIWGAPGEGDASES